MNSVVSFSSAEIDTAIRSVAEIEMKKKKKHFSTNVSPGRFFLNCKFFFRISYNCVFVSSKSIYHKG